MASNPLVLNSDIFDPKRDGSSPKDGSAYKDEWQAAIGGMSDGTIEVVTLEPPRRLFRFVTAPEEPKGPPEFYAGAWWTHEAEIRHMKRSYQKQMGYPVRRMLHLPDHNAGNCVFFCKVMRPIKAWQGIGKGPSSGLCRVHRQIYIPGISEKVSTGSGRSRWTRRFDEALSIEVAQMIHNENTRKTKGVGIE